MTERLRRVIAICDEHGIDINSPIASAIYNDPRLRVRAKRAEARVAPAAPPVDPAWVDTAVKELAVFGSVEGVTTAHVCRARGLPATKANTMACGAALRANGWSKARVAVDCDRRWLYMPPG